MEPVTPYGLAQHSVSNAFNAVSRRFPPTPEIYMDVSSRESTHRPTAAEASHQAYRGNLVVRAISSENLRDLITDSARSAHEASRCGAGVFAVAQHRFAIDEDVRHARGKPVRLAVGGVILDPSGVEHDDVGEKAVL